MCARIDASQLNDYIRNIIKSGKIDFISSKYSNNIKIVNLSKNEGLRGVIYAFSLIYPKKDKSAKLELILKIYQNNEMAVCQNESAILRLLRSKGIPVPLLYVSEINNSILKKPSILMEKVRGEPLGKYLKRVPDKDKFVIIKRFAETLALLHSLDLDNVTFIRHPSNKHEYAQYQALLARSLIKNLKVAGDFDWIINWIESNASLHGCDRYSILHGDMHLDNFLLTPDGKIVLLDWEYPEIGDPLRDVALAYINLIFAVGFRKLHKGIKIGEFFICQYVKKLNQKIDLSTLRFYIVASALIEAICYRFNCKRVLGSLPFIRRSGLRFYIGAPLLFWYFWWRYKILERLIKEEAKYHDLFVGGFTHKKA
jgi:aminoglycoside phosphotransferase (APT) family kinase protein